MRSRRWARLVVPFLTSPMVFGEAWVAGVRTDTVTVTFCHCHSHNHNVTDTVTCHYHSSDTWMTLFSLQKTEWRHSHKRVECKGLEVCSGCVWHHTHSFPPPHHARLIGQPMCAMCVRLITHTHCHPCGGITWYTHKACGVQCTAERHSVPAVCRCARQCNGASYSVRRVETGACGTNVAAAGQQQQKVPRTIESKITTSNPAERA